VVKFVPWLLQNEQKQHHLEVRRESQHQLLEDPNVFRRLSLASSGLFFFPDTNIKLKGRRFDTVEEIQAETETVLNTPTTKDFQDLCQRWQKNWDRCVSSQGDYFRGYGAECNSGKTE
jgi:hypothetical protein